VSKVKSCCWFRLCFCFSCVPSPLHLTSYTDPDRHSSPSRVRFRLFRCVFGFPSPNSAPPPTILLPTIPETSTIDLYHPYPRYTSLFPKRCHLQNHISDPYNKTAITFRSELETGQKYTFRKSAENSGSRCPRLCRVRRTFFCENRPGRLRYRAPKFLHPCV